ncbi:MAG: hypothetical protein ACE5PM_01845 [Candidatus Hydrothermarchaeales archaeon]
MVANAEKDLKEAVDFYLGLKHMLEDLEDAIKLLIILASMGIWLWIVMNLTPLFDIIGKYTSEWIGFLVHLVVLGGWLVVHHPRNKVRCNQCQFIPQLVAYPIL